MRLEGVMGGLWWLVKPETQLVTSCDDGKDGRSRGNSSSHSFVW